MPNRRSTCEPTTIAAASSRKQFQATCRDNARRATVGRSADIDRKIGAVPRGLTIGINAATANMAGGGMLGKKTINGWGGMGGWFGGGGLGGGRGGVPGQPPTHPH